MIECVGHVGCWEIGLGVPRCIVCWVLLAFICKSTDYNGVVDDMG